MSETEARRSSKTVAVVVPLYPRDWLTPEEEIAFRHMAHYLERYDKYLVIPKSLKFKYPGFDVKRFSNKYFGTADRYSKLLARPEFYEAFREYKYILMHEPDAIVFSDQLMEWCETDLDYIGAPWLHCEDTPFHTRERVGNFGFSLQKVESFLKVLYSEKYTIEPDDYWNYFCARYPKHKQFLHFPKKYLKRIRRFNCARWRLYRIRMRADSFWSDEAVYYVPDFKVASFETGLKFAFEAAPRLCYERNGHVLPFGSHKWWGYDREFWEPYLLT